MTRTYLRLNVSEKKEAEFWSHVQKGSSDECWPWSGRTRGGYGIMSLENRAVTASRVAWVLANGKQPEGLICHTCDNPPCCNPAHLWDGTSADNSRDMTAKGRNSMSRKTHCLRGHAFTPENTYRYRNKRICRACVRAASAALRAGGRK